MLRSIARFFDGIAIKLMIGTLMKQIKFEYEKAGYPTKEAEHLARAEMMASLESHLVDIDSYHEVRRWTKSYMAGRGRIPDEGR